MSRNSKNAQRVAMSKTFKRASFNKALGKSTPTGNRGPAQTEPKHGKRRARSNIPHNRPQREKRRYPECPRNARNSTPACIERLKIP